ncbi:MAG TPA: sigma-54 dependent transcriptional regulator [Puia sp.]|jgi:two-component system response regulator HydG|nr:sigma-54 dependent transcriptional regulator [Puia sp.]
MKRILIIDDDADMCVLLSNFLTKHGYETETASSGKSGIANFSKSNFDAVLCDYRLGDMNGKDVLIEIIKHNPAIIFLIFTGYSDIKTAVEVIKFGAHDYIVKPVVPEEILNILSTALGSSKNKIDDGAKPAGKINKAISKSENNFFRGNDPATKELYKQVALVAPTNYSIILYGESGTGKEVVAKDIHELSSRNLKPFISLDCGTLNKELSGSELFGHVKGSFTDAHTDKAGHFELANGGTLFLDEVANLSLDVQSSLLRVIQERKIKRVGGNKEIDIDVRIIVASNEDLPNAHKKRKFREDLYHRLNEFSINLPALRDRKKDIKQLANFFLAKVNLELGKSIDGFDDDVITLFANYKWPGNIRELKNVVRRAALLTNEKYISSRSLPWEILPVSNADKSLSNKFT